MRKKIIGIFVCIMLVLTAVVIIVPKDLNVEATSDEGEEKESTGLDYEYIYNITKRLSFIINDTTIYPPGTIPKGRFFGTEGEQYAAREILQDEMLSMGLYNPCSGPEPYLERVENLNFLDFPEKLFPPYMNVTSKIDTIAQGGFGS